MKTRFNLLIIFTLFLAACSPTASVQPSPVIETSPPATDPGYQTVVVDGVDVEVGVGSPIPVHVIVNLSLPDTCSQIELIELQREGSTFRYSLSTLPSSAEGCIQDSLPFRLKIPLNSVGLTDGTYTVNVNGIPTTFEWPAQPTVITLERTVCFGTCPVYTLTIYGDGRVEYDGKQFVEVTGVQTSTLTAEQVKELVDEFVKADYFNMADEYVAPVTDIPSTITSITLDGQSKTVRNYGGCLEGSPVPAPEALCDLETRIDEVANTAQWFGTP